MFFLGLFLFQNLSARHLLGGSAAYQVLSKNAAFSTLDLEFFLIRNNLGGGANFDSQAEFGIFGFKNNEYKYLTTVYASFGDIEAISLNFAEDCPELSYSQTSYTLSIDLPNSEYEHYLIGYVRCCGSADVSNIINADEMGLALSIKIYPKAFEYSERAEGISVSKLPYLLNNQEFYEWDLSIEDDYIKEYRLTAPSVGGGVAGVNFGDPRACDGITPDPQNCPPPYDSVEYLDIDNPYGIGSDVDIDKDLGQLSVQIPVVAMTLFQVSIDRFIEGELLSTINTQWITTSSTCNVEPLTVTEDDHCKALFIAPNPSSASIHASCALKEIVIYDMFGRRVKSLEKMQVNEKVVIKELNHGIYIIKGKRENGDYVNLSFVKSPE
jgi:hypothetical protein